MQSQSPESDLSMRSPLSRLRALELDTRPLNARVINIEPSSDKWINHLFKLVQHLYTNLPAHWHLASSPFNHFASSLSLVSEVRAVVLCPVRRDSESKPRKDYSPQKTQLELELIARPTASKGQPVGFGIASKSQTVGSATAS